MISSIQIKAARSLLRINQGDLAEISGLSLLTIQNLEKEESKLQVASVGTVNKIKTALEARGIRFFNDKKDDSTLLHGVALEKKLP